MTALDRPGVDEAVLAQIEKQYNSVTISKEEHQNLWHLAELCSTHFGVNVDQTKEINKVLKKLTDE